MLLGDPTEMLHLLLFFFECHRLLLLLFDLLTQLHPLGLQLGMLQAPSLQRTFQTLYRGPSHP